MKKFFLLTFLLTALPFAWTRAAVDPNFYIFLCFGQSNMEGAAKPTTIPVDACCGLSRYR